MTADAVATTAAEKHVEQLLVDLGAAVNLGTAVDLDMEETAASVVDEFEVEYERRPGQRRLVLRTGWEVDPAAVRSPDAQP